jgi:hypothetical protein
MEEDNKKTAGITIEQLRQLKSFENIPEEKAREIISSIKNLVVICYEFLNQPRKKSITNEGEAKTEQKTKEKKMKKIPVKIKKQKRKKLYHKP